jgi:putative endonuclease
MANRSAMVGRAEQGSHNESRAAGELIRRGYRIVERNFRRRLGELDVVAFHRGVLVFVEVRSRRNAAYGGGIAAVPLAKQRQVARIAALYIATRQPCFTTCRFDVVAITGTELVVIEDAFRITW